MSELDKLEREFMWKMQNLQKDCSHEQLGFELNTLLSKWLLFGVGRIKVCLRCGAFIATTEKAK